MPSSTRDEHKLQRRRPYRQAVGTSRDESTPLTIETVWHTLYERDSYRIR
jgi:hypothetical protein